MNLNRSVQYNPKVNINLSSKFYTDLSSKLSITYSKNQPQLDLGFLDVLMNHESSLGYIGSSYLNLESLSAMLALHLLCVAYCLIAAPALARSALETVDQFRSLQACNAGR